MLKKLLLFLVVLTLTACTESEKVYKIGVAQCSKGRWREKVNQEMLAAQHLYEHHVKVSIANSFDDSEWQARQIDSLAQTGIDLLVVAPNEDIKVINDAIGRVRKAGIPVICFDRKTSADYTAFIGGNNVEAGKVAGNYVLSLLSSRSNKNEKDKVVEITGAMTSSPAQERHEGFLSVMKEHSEVEYICQDADWTSDEACRIAKEQIDSSLRQLDRTIIFFCHNDGMATGVYKAVVEKGVEGKVMILGIDGLPDEGIEYVQLGHQVGSYVYPTHGELIVKLALNILTGQPYERDNELQGMMVTPENADIMPGLHGAGAGNADRAVGTFLSASRGQP